MDPDPGHEHSLIFPEFFLTKQNCQKISSFFRLFLCYNLITIQRSGKFYNLSFPIVQIWVLRLKEVFSSGFDILPLGSGSVDPHVFADLDLESQNVADPKHWFLHQPLVKSILIVKKLI